MGLSKIIDSADFDVSLTSPDGDIHSLECCGEFHAVSVIPDHTGTCRDSYISSEKMARHPQTAILN